MIEINPSGPTFVEKRKGPERKHRTNCYDCEILLDARTMKVNPNDEGDRRFFCKAHWKKRFGKRKKLIKR